MLCGGSVWSMRHDASLIGSREWGLETTREWRVTSVAQRSYHLNTERHNAAYYSTANHLSSEQTRRDTTRMQQTRQAA